VRLGNTYTIFIDGEFVQEAVDESPSLPDFVGWTISGRPTARLNGFIDELRISHEALRPSDFLCSRPEISLEDTPNDQGGYIDVSWQRFASDDDWPIDPITYYEVQRLEDHSWMALGTLAVAPVDTYVTTVTTDDIYVVGMPESYSAYRVIGRTDNPEADVISLPDSSYSVDNLAPPTPIVTMHEVGANRFFGWEIPDIPDYGIACLFERENQNDPYMLVCCTDEPYISIFETQPRYYAVSHVDIHGNESELSEEMYPTSVPGDGPTAFSLSGNRPNPFNPSTAISYELPIQSPVTLRIFDLAGRLVDVLVEGEVMAAGTHTATWTGRDSHDRTMPSGTYFYRLEADGFVETRRMTLIR